MFAHTEDGHRGRARGEAPVEPARYGRAVPGPNRTEIRTRLASLRVSRGVTQAEMAAAIGIAMPTYRRLERGRMASPPLRYLTNAAIALGVELDDVIEDEWREWHVFDAHGGASPPEPQKFWRTP
jgi:DNA-binding XRE family transcriptional regulator